jgi:SAUR family protein
LGRKSNSDFGSDLTYVPQDVKEGHFAVIAADGGQMKRFVVALSYLSHPRFLDLLEQAAEEYGFDREGALTIPCPPSDLEKILHDEQWQQEEEDSLI